MMKTSKNNKERKERDYTIKKNITDKDIKKTGLYNVHLKMYIKLIWI